MVKFQFVDNLLPNTSCPPNCCQCDMITDYDQLILNLLPPVNITVLHFLLFLAQCHFVPVPVASVLHR